MDDTLVARLATHLTQRGQRLCTAESCTGGWIAKRCTDAAGSSAWFECAWVTYSNASKQRLLGVPAAAIEDHGAVSEAVVCAMARSALVASDADWSIAVSGIAGPGGGTADKPVGTVWLAWAGPDDWLAARRYVFDGDRDAVRRQTVSAALRGLLERLDGDGA